jgi:hypothetical protein
MSAAECRGRLAIAAAQPLLIILTSFLRMLILSFLPMDAAASAMLQSNSAEHIEGACNEPNATASTCGLNSLKTS